ncbi:hypothetical protein KAW48_07790, partial [candidate division WOR-3 bacterium]|nr:hypothetical protein [candidate division WOR-3 bacterium]
MMKDRRIHKRRDISWKILLSIFTMGIIVNIEASSIKTFSVVYTDCPPVIDGNLIDPCWGDAHKVEMFIQQEPKAGKPAVEQTIVYCLYDKENLYFGI